MQLCMFYQAMAGIPTSLSFASRYRDRDSGSERDRMKHRAKGTETGTQRGTK